MSGKIVENLTLQARGLHGNLKMRTGNPSEILIFGDKAIFKYNIHSRKITDTHQLFEAQDIIISSISTDSQENIWIGTDQGLYLLKRETQEPVKIESSLFNYITCVITDNQDNLWIGTSGNLFRYVTRENRFVIYDESDGVAHNEYIDKSCLKTSGGEIYMGGITGFLRINAIIPPETPYTPSIEVEEILFNGLPLKHTEYEKDRKIKLSPGNTSLGIRLMVKGKYLFNKRPIRYRLTGLNSELITTSDPMVYFFNLPPGEYHFMVESTQNNGEWTRATDVLTIRVMPYWWNSWWFYLLIGVFIITLLSSFFLYYKRKKIREMDQQKVRFLINVNHELRTPLTLISAPISRLLKKKDFTATEARTVLASVNKQAKQMKQVIDMVLDVRKMEVTSEKLQLSYHDFNRWIEETISDFQSEFEANGILLKFEPDEQIKEICFDINKCTKVLNNLLINALKYSEPDTTVTLRSNLRENRVRVSVSDQGIGLSNADPDKLFTRFYQAPQQKGGTGIGLSYSKTLIELHQGQMGAFENPDKGATFYFEIPLNLTEKPVHPTIERMYGEADPIEESQSSVPDPDFLLFRSHSILIVEDQPELNQFLQDTFREYFRQVLCAFNGKEGLEVCLNQHPDIIVSDILMPEMNGLDLCRHIKENIETSHIPVILLTARNSDENAISGYRSGADAYLAKPFEIEALLSLTRNILSTRKKWMEKFKSEGWGVMTDSEISLTRTDQEFLSKLQGVIRNELSNPELDVDLLADQMAVSRSTLYLKMKNLTGMGVKDFINELRINTAMQYLRESDMQIAEISDRTGFSQQRYFSTAFKQATGLTPSQYRGKSREG